MGVFTVLHDGLRVILPVRIQKLDKFSVTGEEEGGHFRAGDKCE
jgi:hypothetical protein